MTPQALPVQARSHLQAEAHWTSPQAFVPLQVMLHVDCVSQLMSLQASPPTQLIVHDQPDGQVMVPAQLLVLVQSTMQVCAVSSQEVQSAGQF